MRGCATALQGTQELWCRLQRNSKHRFCWFADAAAAAAKGKAAYLDVGVDARRRWPRSPTRHRRRWACRRAGASRPLPSLASGDDDSTVLVALGSQPAAHRHRAAAGVQAGAHGFVQQQIMIVVMLAERSTHSQSKGKPARRDNPTTSERCSHGGRSGSQGQEGRDVQVSGARHHVFDWGGGRNDAGLHALRSARWAGQGAEHACNLSFSRLQGRDEEEGRAHLQHRVCKGAGRCRPHQLGPARHGQDGACRLPLLLAAVSCITNSGRVAAGCIHMHRDQHTNTNRWPPQTRRSSSPTMAPRS